MITINKNKISVLYTFVIKKNVCSYLLSFHNTYGRVRFGMPGVASLFLYTTKKIFYFILFCFSSFHLTIQDIQHSEL